jgi:hypothetical protein
MGFRLVSLIFGFWSLLCRLARYPIYCGKSRRVRKIGPRVCKGEMKDNVEKMVDELHHSNIQIWRE